MAEAHDSDCYFDGKKTVSGEFICLRDTCMICKGGKWEKTNRIAVL